MKKGWVLVLTLFLIIIIGLVVLVVLPASTANAPTGANTTATTTPDTTNPYADELQVDVIKSGSKVASPLTVTGKARGWYFEASFPVKLLDANGIVLAQGPATLVLMNDNPSGLPENQKEVSTPVTF